MNIVTSPKRWINNFCSLFPYDNLAIVEESLRNVRSFKVHESSYQCYATIIFFTHQEQRKEIRILFGQINILACLLQYHAWTLGRVTVYLYPIAVHQVHIHGCLAWFDERWFLLSVQQKGAQIFTFWNDWILTDCRRLKRLYLWIAIREHLLHIPNCK